MESMKFCGRRSKGLVCKMWRRRCACHCPLSSMSRGNAAKSGGGPIRWTRGAALSGGDGRPAAGRIWICAQQNGFLRGKSSGPKGAGGIAVGRAGRRRRIMTRLSDWGVCWKNAGAAGIHPRGRKSLRRLKWSKSEDGTGVWPREQKFRH